MRLLLEALGWSLDVTLAQYGHSSRPEPDPQGSTCGVLERVSSWDHDQRVPLGFAAATRAPDHTYPTGEST